MKKYLLPMLIAACLCRGLWAQDLAPERKFALTAQPLSLLGGTARVAFQYKIFDYLALSAPFSIGKDWFRPSFIKIMTKNESTMSPFDASFGLGARFFPRSMGFRDGWYLEPNVRIAWTSGIIERKSDKFKQVAWKSTLIKPTLRIGYSWFWESGFMMSWGFDIGASHAFKHAYEVHDTDSTNDDIFNHSAFKWFMDVQDKKWAATFETEWSMGFSW